MAFAELDAKHSASAIADPKGKAWVGKEPLQNPTSKPVLHKFQSIHLDIDRLGTDLVPMAPRDGLARGLPVPE